MLLNLLMIGLMKFEFEESNDEWPIQDHQTKYNNQYLFEELVLVKFEELNDE